MPRQDNKPNWKHDYFRLLAKYDDLFSELNTLKHQYMVAQNTIMILNQLAISPDTTIIEYKKKVKHYE